MFRPAARLTMDNAGQTLEAGLQAMAAGESEFDFSDLLNVDSSAVAVMLEWQRQAQALGKGASLRFSALPANLQSLIALYGIADLLPVVMPMPATMSTVTSASPVAPDATGIAVDPRHH